MTYEEMERTMQFILAQQARFSANQQGVEERVTRLETNMAGLQANMDQMARSQTHVNEVLAVMLETHRHTEQ